MYDDLLGWRNCYVCGNRTLADTTRIIASDRVIDDMLMSHACEGPAGFKVVHSPFLFV